MEFAAKKREHRTVREIALPVLSFLVVLCVVWIALGNLSQGTDEQMLLVLINESAMQDPVIGGSYSLYAHVSAHQDGRYMYNAAYYPQLITLYMDLYAN